MNPDQRVVQEAIAWMVTLQSGTASLEDHAACQRWQAQDAQHALAWERLRGLAQPVQQIPPALAMQTLGNATRTAQQVQALLQRRQALKMLLLVTGSAGVLGLGYKHVPWQPMLAQYTTRVGQKKRVMLADGTEVMLNTATALDSDFDASTRRLRFYHGEILLTTGPESHVHQASALAANTAHRPFIVETAQGSLRALGTRFLVRQREHGIGLAVFEGAVEVNNGGQRQIVQAGQQLAFSRARIGAVQGLNPDASAWMDGLLIARAMPLADFLQELNRYRRGHISVDPALAQLTISGVFPLQQPERVLQAVQETLPVRLVQYWHYWVRVLPLQAQS